MPIPFIQYVLDEGPPPWLVNNARTLIYTFSSILIISLLKYYSSGRSNLSERNLHGRVFIVTGGTSGVGAGAVQELAARGAQLCLLTQAPQADPFLVEYIQDLRASTNNQMIYAEQVDLSSLHSIRKFATKWIDNSPPRRLDGILLMAATMVPPGGKRIETEEGIEETWMVNFLANFHLLGILSPAIRAQPVDRDVRIIMTSCASYIGSPSLKKAITPETWSPATAYSRSKLALNVFGQAFQKHLSSYKRPDGMPMNAHVLLVDPGYCRTPGMRRWLTRGSLWGLMLYLIAYIVPWVFLKSPQQGSQSILHAIMESRYGRGDGGQLIKECMEVDFARPEVRDEEVAKKLWEESDALIEKTEKATAKKRGLQKGEEEKASQKKKDQETKDEVAGLVDAIKKGKEQEKKKKEAKKGKGSSKSEKGK